MTQLPTIPRPAILYGPPSILKRTIDHVAAPAISPVPPKRPNLSSSDIFPPPPTSFTLTPEEAIALGLKITERLLHKELYMVDFTKNVNPDSIMICLDKLVKKARAFTPVPQALLDAQNSATEVRHGMWSGNATGYGMHMVAIESDAAHIIKNSKLIHPRVISGFIKRTRASLEHLESYAQDFTPLTNALTEYMKQFILYFASFDWTVIVVPLV